MLCTEDLHPCLNMGVDEALLRSNGPPTLRLYGWNPPGLSLGYFQNAAPLLDVPGDHVMVRRLTGGGAIYHQHEITFSITLDAECMPAEIARSYAEIHQAISLALAETGIPTTAARNPATAKTGRAARPRTPWCFLEATPGDLLTSAGRKVLGSAQRRLCQPRPRILHHGSLVMIPPAATPACGSVVESIDPDLVKTALGDRIVAYLASALGLSPEEGEMTSAEKSLALDLSRTLYGSETFLLRR